MKAVYELDKNDIEQAIAAWVESLVSDVTIKSCKLSVRKEIDDRGGDESYHITATVEVS